MPYLNSQRKEYLKGQWTEKPNGGDINYLATELIIEKMFENTSYQTIHEIRKACYDPATDDKFWELRATLLEHGVADIDIREGFKNAYHEFYRRVVGLYEDFAAARNGDVYEKLVDHIFNKFEGVVTK